MVEDRLARIIQICGDAPLGHHADKFLQEKHAVLKALDGPDVLLPIRSNEWVYPYTVIPNHGVSGGNAMFDVVWRKSVDFTRPGWDPTPLYEILTSSLRPAMPACGTASGP